MTQLQSVQTWSDDELNKAVSTEVMGYTVMDDYRDHMNEYAEQIYYDKKNRRYICKISKLSPCSDVAASLEVQAKAIEVDGPGYIDNLITIVWEIPNHPDYLMDDGEWIKLSEVTTLLNATPRQRSEAAYLTIKFQP